MFTTISCIKPPGQMVITNCTIYTLDGNNPIAEAIITADGKIIYVGDEMGSLPYINEDSQIIDLNGGYVIPGLIDAHCHLNGLGKMLEDLNLMETTSIAEIREMVLAKVKETEPGKWIQGRGWDQNKWKDQKFPHWRDLNGTERNPVYLRRVDGHAVWVNNTALELCSIDADTPDPPGGLILRDSAGQPTGVLLDNAADLVKNNLPVPSKEDRRRWFLQAMKECSRLGLTGAGDAGMKREDIEVIKELAEEGKLTMRIYAMLSDEDPDLLEDYFISGPEIGLYDDLLTIRTVKLYADGALGSKGALLCQPYSDQLSTVGINVDSLEYLYDITKRALAAGFQVAAHAIGDSANKIVIDTYQRALQENPVKNHRLRIEHAQVLSEPDIARMAESNIIASMQPTHATSDMPWAEQRLGSERIRYAYAWRTLKDAGVKLAFGSDFPIEYPNPFYGIHAAVTRQDKDNNPPDGWYPEQKMTVMEALQGFTTWAAYAQFQEEETGMIRPGYKADFTIIDRDIFHIPQEQLDDIQVLMTIVKGEIVYSKM